MRKRLIPIRDADFLKKIQTEPIFIEKVANDLINRHAPLGSVDINELMKCLQIIQKSIYMESVNDAHVEPNVQSSKKEPSAIRTAKTSSSSSPSSIHTSRSSLPPLVLKTTVIKRDDQPKGADEPKSVLKKRVSFKDAHDVQSISRDEDYDEDEMNFHDFSVDLPDDDDDDDDGDEDILYNTDHSHKSNSGSKYTWNPGKQEKVDEDDDLDFIF